MSRLTCNAILRLVNADFTSSATFDPHEFIRNLKYLFYSTSVILVLPKIFACPSGKLSTEFTSPIAKSTSTGLSDTTFFARRGFMLLGFKDLMDVTEKVTYIKSSTQIKTLGLWILN